MNKFAHAYLTKLAALKEKEETRASKVMKGGLTGAAIGGLGLGATGAIRGAMYGYRIADRHPLSDEVVAEVNRDLKEYLPAGTLPEIRALTEPPLSKLLTEYHHDRQRSQFAVDLGKGDAVVGTAAGIVGGGALGILYGMLR